MDRGPTDVPASLQSGPLRLWDPDVNLWIVAAHPSQEPDLWKQYVAGALDSYRSFDVESALEYDAMSDGTTSAVLMAVLRPDGVVVGGFRAFGPLQSSRQAHAPGEWFDPELADRVRKHVDERIPSGVAEGKSAWVARNADRRRSLTAALALMAIYCMDILDVRYLLGTAGENSLRMWSGSGCTVNKEIPPSPYPDERFHTRLMWWDREDDRPQKCRKQVAALLASASGGD